MKNLQPKYYIGIGIIILIAIIIIFSGGSSDKDQEDLQKGSVSKSALIWHDVISFSGSGDGIDKNTQPFPIKGSQWRIKWNFQDSGEFGDETNGLFIIAVHRIGESSATERFSYSGLTNSDINYIYEGKGDFYLDITSYNAKGYSIAVEDLY